MTNEDLDLAYIAKLLLELLIAETVTANGFSKQAVRQAEAKIRAAHREVYGFDQPSSEQLNVIFNELDEPKEEK